MSTLEAALRGGAIVVLLLRVVMRLQNARRDPVGRYSALLLVSIAAYVAESAPGFDTLDLRWRAPIHVLSAGTPAAFWIAIEAIFVDEFRLRSYHALAWIALMALGAITMVRHPMSVDVARTGLSVTFLLFGIFQAVAGRASDLVENRRRLRIWYAIIIAIYGILVIVSEWIRPGGLSAMPLSLINAMGLIGFIFSFAVIGVQQVEAPSGSVAVHAGPAPCRPDSLPVASRSEGPDAALITALRRLIDHDRIYRAQDVSITSLSQKLSVPEYRLRRVINGQLGHRNFNAFINSYRLAEAEAALSDPGQAEVPILTIALDAGFGSMGPFNRAFRAQTGVTPTEYRRARLGGQGDLQRLGSSQIPKSTTSF